MAELVAALVELFVAVLMATFELMAAVFELAASVASAVLKTAFTGRSSNDGEGKRD